MTFRLRSKKRRFAVKSDVNLTPLIDVMTSLLAIFMITAPLLTTGIPLELPRGDGKTLVGEEKTLDLSVNRKGEVFIGKRLLNSDEILPKVKAIVTENPNIRMIISADKDTSYGNVIELMALLRAAGYTQVGLKTDIQTVKVSKQVSKRTP
mgnify:FL=1